MGGGAYRAPIALLRASVWFVVVGAGELDLGVAGFAAVLAMVTR